MNEKDDFIKNTNNDSIHRLSGYIEVIKDGTSYILFNKLNGCIVLFEEEHIFIKESSYFVCDAEDSELDFLRDNQFFVEDSVIQNHIIENLSTQTLQDKVDIVLSVTEKCNLACKYCYQFDWNKCDSLSDEEYIANIQHYLVSILPSLYTNRSTLNIYYMGGEPLLKSNLIIKITDMIQKQVDGRIPVRYNLDSNALLLSRDFILHFPNLQICTTLTTEDDHNFLRSSSYNSVICKIKELKDLFDSEKYRLIIRYNVHNNNIQGIDTILSELESLNFKWEFDVQNIMNSEGTVFHNQLSDIEYQSIYLKEIVPIMLRHGLHPRLLPEHTLSRHCRGISTFDRKFYSNGYVTLCDAFPKENKQNDIPRLLPLPDMCIKCLDFPYCGGPKPCDKESCKGEYMYKENAIERIKTYVRSYFDN